MLVSGGKTGSLLLIMNEDPPPGIFDNCDTQLGGKVTDIEGDENVCHPATDVVGATNEGRLCG